MRSADEPPTTPPESERPGSAVLFDHEADAAGDADAAGHPGTPAGTAGIVPGQLLAGRYRVGARIGAGGMATIYRGRDERLERPVAIKVLHAHLVDDAELHARFAGEGRRAATLTHPNIVGVHDEGVDGLPYIVMELVDGPSLRDVLHARERFTPAESLARLAPVARALRRAHDAGIVHRDIKPENVLVAPDGTPKVADFGIARLLAGTNHTQTGSLIGSVHYMAPELVDGGEASSASDQYALGVVLYEMLAGERPFRGDTPMAVALRHARERVPAPSERGADADPAVDAVVARATAPAPGDRYPDLGALADALAAAVPDGPTQVVLPASAVPGEHTLVIGDATTEPVDDEPAATAPDGPAPPQGSGASPAPEQDPAPDRDPAPAAATTAAAAAPATRRRRTGRRIAVVAAVVLFLLAAVAGGAAAWWHWVLAPLTPVPDVVGLDEQAAFDELATHDLGLAIGEEVHDDTAPPGEVIAQRPSTGEEVRAGEVVVVDVSLGRPFTEVPSVVGSAEDDALAAIADAALESTRDEAHHDDVPAGDVIRQDPEAGTELREGDEVAIVVSLGVEQVEVPDLVGIPQGEAEAALADADLAIGDVARDWSDEYPTEGTVIAQGTDAGAEVDKGSVVDLRVSLGPRTIEMPNVRGAAVEDAQAELEALSLEVIVDGSPRPTFGPFTRGQIGLVEEQLPGPGEAIGRGEAVTLFTYDE